MNNAQKTANEILTSKKETLERIAKKLIEQETIEQEEFKEMVK